MQRSTASVESLRPVILQLWHSRSHVSCHCLVLTLQLHLCRSSLFASVRRAVTESESSPIWLLINTSFAPIIFQMIIAPVQTCWFSDCQTIGSHGRRRATFHCINAFDASAIKLTSDDCRLAPLATPARMAPTSTEI